MMSSKVIDNSIKVRATTILKLAIPVVIALLSMDVMMMVDLAMVSSLGNTAIASIGISIFLSSSILAFIFGYSPVVQAIVARRSGEGSSEPKCLPLNAGLLLVLIVGIPITLVCYVSSPFLLSLISSDVEVVRESTPYIRALFIAAVGAGMNSVFGGFWNGIAKVKIYTLVILITNGINVILNYVFIYGKFGVPALGVTGAGIATALSTYIGTLVYIGVTIFRFRAEGFISVKPSMALITRVFKFGLPGSVVGASLSLGYIIFYWMVGLVGTAELAATNIVIRIGLFAALFPKALGIVSTTLVSNTLGKGDSSKASQWGWDAAKIAVLWHTCFIAIPLFVFAEEVLSLFLTDSKTVEMAIVPLQLFAISGIYASLVFIFAQTLTGLGEGKRVLIVTFGTQWLLGLPLIWLIGPYLNYGLLEIWYVRIAYGILTTVMIVSLWNQGRWKEIKL